MQNRELRSYQAISDQAVLNRCLKRCVSDSLIGINLNLAEWLMLGYVVDRGPKGVRNTTIAYNLRLEMPVVTKMVQKAIKSGWLEAFEDSKDGRAKRVVATNNGIKMVYSTDMIVKKRAASWLGDIDPHKLKDYFEVSAKLAEKSKKK